MARICKVLIVENDNYIAELLGELFDEEGFLFAILETGAGIEEKLDEDDYDIVVIDCTQPGDKDGVALAEIARARGCGVILTSGDHRLAGRLRQSSHFYLLKPFRMHELIATAEKILAMASIACVRRSRRDGSYFPERSA